MEDSQVLRMELELEVKGQRKKWEHKGWRRNVLRRELEFEVKGQRKKWEHKGWRKVTS